MNKEQSTAPNNPYDALTSFITYLESFPKWVDTFDLVGYHKLLTLLDSPHQKLAEKAIHVVGSNGKGSTTAFCSRILQAENYRVGRYTSPHLTSYRERIQINDNWIKETDFIRWVNRIKKILKKNFQEGEKLPTWFEVITTIALGYFVEQQCDFVILEAGLGGRLDATSVVDGGRLICTSLSLEHTQILGNTILEIATEKAALIRPGTKTFFPSSLPDEGKQVIQKRCKETGSTATEVSVHVKSVTWQGTTFSITKPATHEHSFTTAMVGTHQATNAALAVSACAASPKANKHGLATTHLEGRFELLSRENLEGIPDKISHIVLDGAHNQESMTALVNTISALRQPDDLVIALIQCMRDKDSAQLLQTLSTQADVLFALDEVSMLPRALSARELTAKAQDLGIPIELGLGTWHDVLVQAAHHIPGKKQGILIITGSLYLIGEWRKHLLQTATPRSLDQLVQNTDATFH